jgi:hypothetical protein
MLISDEYKDLNTQLHEERDDYGRSSGRHAGAILNLCAQYDTQDILDYGCGKAELNLYMPFAVKCYDPAISKYEGVPEPADIVVCTDVMEHIEPDCLDDVLDDLVRLTRKVCFMTIATRPAVKTLADGRNAHLIVESTAWWMLRITTRFEVIGLEEAEGEFMVILEGLKNESE